MSIVANRKDLNRKRATRYLTRLVPVIALSVMAWVSYGITVGVAVFVAFATAFLPKPDIFFQPEADPEHENDQD